MDRRLRGNEKLLRKWKKIDRAWKEKRSAVETMMQEQKKKEWHLNTLRLAAEAEKENYFGENVKILDVCDGCDNCKNMKECYIVAVAR